MLVLSRKPLERIHIGDTVVVTVLEIRGNRVRIGIEAPGDVAVLRSELTGTTPESLPRLALAIAADQIPELPPNAPRGGQNRRRALLPVSVLPYVTLQDRE